MEVHDGKERRGRLHDVSAGSAVIDPRKAHLVKPWKGDRLVLIAYNIREPWRLVPRDKEQLDALDFNVSEENYERPALKVMNAHARVPEEEATFVTKMKEAVVELTMVIEDLQNREKSLKLLLEEEETLAEQLRRARGVVHEDLSGLQDRVAEFLQGVGGQLEGAVQAREHHLMALAMEAETEVDYERMLEELREPLEVVHTVPLAQVKGNQEGGEGSL